MSDVAAFFKGFFYDVADLGLVKPLQSDLEPLTSSSPPRPFSFLRHYFSQSLIDPRLVAVPGALKKCHDVGIQPQGDRLLDRLVHPG
jgi:hypothetical protein